MKIALLTITINFTKKYQKNMKIPQQQLNVVED